jgi:MinD-like ATPase involved in chromosome partitioning or flagellar assembly
MPGPMWVAVSPTKLDWSTNIRAYKRDHTTDVNLEVTVTPRALLQPCHRSFDVLLVDDTVRLFSAADIAAAHDRQIHVIGLSDPARGQGRAYLEQLGADQVIAVSTPPAVLAELVRAIGPKNAHTEPARRSVVQSPRTAVPARRGSLTAFMPTSGGAGLSEALVAVAEALVRARQRVLVVEADEVHPVLANRLRRSVQSGLPWALSRAQQAKPVFPEALSGPSSDGLKPIGGFDAVCGVPSPGGPTAVNPVDLTRALDEAMSIYDHVLVDTGPWLTSQTGRDRLGAARATLGLAARVVAFGRSTPDGAAQLVEWRANAHENGVGAPLWAVLGRCRDKYERAHLGHILDTATLPVRSFAGVFFLPEDGHVAKARWNAQLVERGPWWRAVGALARDLAGPSPVTSDPGLVDVRQFGVKARVATG